jgi:hypothetical protein
VAVFWSWQWAWQWAWRSCQLAYPSIPPCERGTTWSTSAKSSCRKYSPHRAHLPPCRLRSVAVVGATCPRDLDVLFAVRVDVFCQRVTVIRTEHPVPTADVVPVMVANPPGGLPWVSASGPAPQLLVQQVVEPAEYRVARLRAVVGGPSPDLGVQVLHQDFLGSLAVPPYHFRERREVALLGIVAC